jgi:hypothetical protein
MITHSVMKRWFDAFTLGTDRAVTIFDAPPTASRRLTIPI